MRHMKNTYKYILVSSLFIGGGLACTNLDENLKDTYTKKFTPANIGLGISANKNLAQPSDGLQGAFNTLLTGTATNGGFFAVQETGTDEAVITQKGGDWYDGGLYIRFHQHQFTPQTWAINDAWNNAYAGITQSNKLIVGPPALNAEQTAQLRFLRAYYYWRLMDVFGRVKLIKEGQNDAAQVDRVVLFNYIESELLAAIPNLTPGLQNYGRANQAGAWALLSRLYLNAGIYTGTPRYADAITYADKVINSGLYSLAANYADVFAPDNCQNNGTSEMIFVVPFDQSTGQGSTWPHMTLHYPSQLTYKLTAQPWNGFATLEDFYNSYDAADKRKAANFISGPQYYFGTDVAVLDLAYDKADPDGAPVNYTPHINELYPNSSRQGGARFGKFAIKTFQGTNSDNDYPILRLGEVILNKAEALQRLNGAWTDDGTAKTLVNQIRARAGAPAFGGMTEKDMLAERGRELFVESIRRTDMIRFGAYFGSWWENPGDPDPAHHGVMAIPIEQMQQNGVKQPDGSTILPLTQNPGY